MRPLRLLLSLSTCLVAILALSYIAASRSRTATSTSSQSSGNLKTYFDWHSPSSLFPPSAIISLTDDNSTNFLARPANFGPPLPTRGLSGQLWIGSGFGDDHLGRGGVAGAEGELGCSDVPGWSDGDFASNSGSSNDGSMKSKNTKGTTEKAKAKAKAKAKEKAKSGKSRRSTTTHPEFDAATADGQLENNDGTDDHLHHPLQASSNLKTSSESAEASKKLDHADIQSLQETAEIAGKVVLLSRGGCGFLEKVKWVQRRGGVALIVGDDIRGGPLVTMYARGDTSNVSIPSLFTSHTTAHLLSTLMPSGGLFADLSDEEVARLGLGLGDKSNQMSKGNIDSKKADFAKQQRPTFKDSSSQSSHDGTQPGKDQSSQSENGDFDDQDDSEDGWFAGLFGETTDNIHKDSRRPPSSGKIDWVLQEDFEDDEPISPKAKSRSGSASTKQDSALGKSSGDGFVIGVQDWRDPDLLDSQLDVAEIESSERKAAGDGTPVPHGGPNGGSITPGSGEYGHNKHAADTKSSTKQSTKAEHKTSEQEVKWLSRLSWSGKDSQAPPKNAHDPSVKSPHVVSQVGKAAISKTESPSHDGGEDEPHDGLWITLTPTSMSSSPFFDTLLVLVVSPLVTLTIVYALLLLRSRIRRRRWRAPKSVVDKLPVRTYQTIPSPASTTTNSSDGSPPTTPTSTTPLLQSGARPISQTRARPRSRTASEVPASSVRDTNAPDASLDQVQEKREAALAEWRRRYGGRQKECVVCLEEYVDGVSRVMSLPCGHEFHAECITPWLTTRRRTCPICKGDVVRSLARSTGSSSSQPLLQQSRFHHGESEDEEDESRIDEIQEQAAETRNDDPLAAEPVSREFDELDDLERGIDGDRTR